MKLITTPAYKFNELEEVVRDRVVNQSREYYSNLWDGEHIEEEFREHMSTFGGEEISVASDISYSQGSGSSFTCSFEPARLLKALYKYSDKYLKLVEFIESDSVALNINVVRSSNSYCHENTMSVEIDIENNNSECLTHDELDYFYDNLEEDVFKFVISEAKSLHLRLQEDYECFTSDDVIIDNLESIPENWLTDGTPVPSLLIDQGQRV